MVDEGQSVGLTRRFGHCGFHEAEHGLLQLRIHFVCDGHHVEQHGGEVNAAQIILQNIEDADLKNPRLFYDHGDSVALLAAEDSVFARGAGNRRFRIGWEKQTTDEVGEKKREMASSVVVRQRECC